MVFKPGRTTTNVLFICSVLLVFMRLRQGYDGDWSPIATLMYHPGQIPVFGHRLLFVGVAWIFRFLPIFPADVLYCYYLSQIVALLWSFSMVGLLVREIVGPEEEFAAYPLLALMLVSTLDYFTYFDIAIVGFYAACLVLLLKQRHALFLITLAIGLLNHENLMLMAGVGVLYIYGTRNHRKAAVLAVASLGIYAAERYLLQTVLPLDPPFAWNWPENVHPLSTYGFRPLFNTAAALLLPVSCILMGFRHSHRLLKMAGPLVLLGITVLAQLFGKWNEPRMFGALFAIAVPMLLSSTPKRVAALDSRLQ
jgi:hypothetical protein